MGKQKADADFVNFWRSKLTLQHPSSLPRICKLLRQIDFDLGLPFQNTQIV
jgi:hypothetical protein